MSEKLQKIFSFLFLSGCFLFIGFCIFHDMNWVLGDDELFLRTTMMGHPSHSWLGSGRFWPTGLCDYVILLAIPYGKTLTAHLLYNFVIMILSVLGMFFLIKKMTNNNYGIAVFSLLILFSVSSFLQIHMSCIYPERFMFFLQVLFMLFWINGNENTSLETKKYFYIISWLCITYVIFSKEPVFGMVIVVACTNLIFGWKNLRSVEKKFHGSLVASAFIYFVIYVYRFFFRDKYTNNLYGGVKFSTLQNLSDRITEIFSNEPILIVFFILALFRLYFVVIKKDRTALFSDSLLFGAVSYVFAYMFLGLVASYYVFPAIVFALPSLAYWTSKKFTPILVAISIATIIPSSITSKQKVENIFYCRRNDMNLTEKIVDAYLNGAKIYIFTNGESLEKYKYGLKFDNAWEFTVYVRFTNFVLKKKYNSSDENVIIPIQNLSESVMNFSHKNVILCSLGANKKKYFLSKGFRFLGNGLGVDVFANF